jgi:hypothetical protein
MAGAAASLPNGDLEFVSETISGEHGLHPDLDDGSEVFCDVLTTALT